jgi:hypothetical protein
MNKDQLGLIAGNGKFPILFARKARQKQLRVIAAGIRGDTSIGLRPFVDRLAFFHVGQLSELFAYFKAHGVRKVLMAGQVNPENLFDPRVQFDEEFTRIFNAIKDRRADTIFTAIAEKLHEKGMELVDSTFLLKDSMAPRGTLTRRGPSVTELEDIEFGRTIAKMMGGIDVGQTVVVKEKAIVAIEAMEGTDKTIARGGRITRGKAVIIKMSKPNQDLRFDVPVIGPRTLRAIIHAKASCLAIEAQKTIIINKQKCLQMANRHDICIVAV